MWRDFPAKLAVATGCGALVYSRLGYGGSDPCPLPRPIDFMHDEGLRILPQVIAATGIRDCMLIGHSDGGSIAIIYAGGTPAIPLRGLITEAAHLFCEEISVRSIQKAKKAYQEEGLYSKLEKYHGPNTECAFRGWNDVWLDPDFINWNIEAYLPEIRVPMLAIQGEQDEYGTPAQIGAIANQAGAGVEIKMFPQCGHSPHKVQEDATLEIMQSFISRILG